MKKNIYITTTLPYVNGDPHIGFAKEIIRADILARIYEMMGHQVFFNTGTDEHGQKLFAEAQKQNVPVYEYVTKNAQKFKDLMGDLDISSKVNFIRTTDEHHKLAAQEFWKRCETAGYIYKDNYVAKYCVGCELEKTDSELVDGQCPIHPTYTIQEINEENYFFAFSKFQSSLNDLYIKNPTIVVPEHRLKEISTFVNSGLQDFSISRSKEKMSWGVPVPGDDAHVMYVWFDALVNYISCLGWPDDNKFNEFWSDATVYQVCGKDNLRQQSAMWQAMLLSIGIKPTDHILINGFIMGEGGVKMSKSIGNVISPNDIISTYGTDALRYMMIRHLSMFEDSEFSPNLAAEWYNAHLVNGIGNLTNRILKLSQTWLAQEEVSFTESEFDAEFISKIIDDNNSQTAYDVVMSWVKKLDTFISEEKPFSVVKEDESKGKEMIKTLIKDLSKIAYHIVPLMPQTAQKIIDAINSNTMPTAPLFERK